MKTRKALGILSGGTKVNGASSDLLDRAADYIKQYDTENDRINTKKSKLDIGRPFLDVARKKLSKVVSATDENLPVIAKFDTFTFVKKQASLLPSDAGLKKLSKHIESVWHSDPMGVFTYGQVASLANIYGDQFPRSKASAALKNACIAHGLHKLPVAKLARIASRVDDQESYDSLIDSNGLSGNNPEQIRARTLIRGLVSMRDIQLESDADHNAFSSVDDRVANSLVKMAADDDDLSSNPFADDDSSDSDTDDDTDDDIDSDMDGSNLIGPPNMSEKHEKLKSPAEEESEHSIGVEVNPELADGEVQSSELAEAVNIINDATESAEELVEDAPVEIVDYISHEEAEGHTGPVGSPAWAAEEILLEGHEGIPGTEEWIKEELEEIGGDMDMDEDESEDGPADAGPAEGSMPRLNASIVESNLLAGKLVKVGAASININSDDEIEIWNGKTGYACGIEHMDRAISDFIKTARSNALNKLAGRTYVAEIVSVPCAECATVTQFVRSASKEDTYACDCGSNITTRGVEQLIESGHLVVKKVSNKIDDIAKEWLYIVTNSNRDPIEFKKFQKARNPAGYPPVVLNAAIQAFSRLYKQHEPISVDGENSLPAGKIAQTIDKDVRKWANEYMTSGVAGKTMTPELFLQMKMGPHFNPHMAQAMTERFHAALAGGRDAPPTERALPGGKQTAPLPQEKKKWFGLFGGKAGQIDNDLSSKLMSSAAASQAAGCSMEEAMKRMLSEHGDALRQSTESGADTTEPIMNALHSAYTGNGAGEPIAKMPEALPGDAQPEMPEPIQSPVAARSAFKEPKVNKHQTDAVSGKKDLGPDTSGDEMPGPKKITTKSPGDAVKMDKELGPDSSTKDLLPSPGAIKVNHDPKSQSGVKLPNKKM